MFHKTDYSYHLPPELIADTAVHPHHNARLMVVDRTTGQQERESTFWHLDEFLGDDRVLFFNDSRVLPARIALHNVIYETADHEQKTLTEGEIFYLKKRDESHFEALVRPGNKFKRGNVFYIGEYALTVSEFTETGRKLNITKVSDPTQTSSINDFLKKYGALPLPPYIKYTPEKESDYQTAFAKKDGSVAAPTASLHFTQELLNKIQNQKEYLTLHVGLGTFKGINTEDIRQYDIHAEITEISLDIFTKIALLKTQGKKVVAVGTTSCRTLESLPSVWRNLDKKIQKYLDANTCKYWDTLSHTLPENHWIHDIELFEADTGGMDDTSGISTYTLSFSTSIYITPGYTFQVVDDLITNFHLPESSLIVLVAAFLGYDTTIQLYQEAIEKKYRFYSFGDGMYLRGK